MRLELAERKADILDFLRQPHAATDLPPIPRVTREGAIPLSFAQQRFWFFNQLNPDSSVHHLCFPLRFTGTLDADILEQSLNAVLQRHESLRTAFSIADGEPVQMVMPYLPLTLPLADLQHLPVTEQACEIQRLALAETREPFDFEHGPLLRVKLLRTHVTEHVLLLAVHHIVYDGWSHDQFVQELAAFYTSFSTQTPLSLASLPIQYADFAVWQRQHLQGDVFAPHLSYWKQQLDDCPPMLELPLDGGRIAAPDFRSARQSLQLPQDLAEAIESLSQQAGVTLFMTLLSAFNILLSRYTNREDVLVGSLDTDRDGVEMESVIGCFMNILVLRTNLSGAPAFRELLLRVRDVCLEANAHKALPFEKLVEALRPGRTSIRNPFFQVLFNYVRLGTGQRQLENLTIEPMPRPEIATEFDLTLYAREQDHGIQFEVVYDPSQFTTSRMAEFLEQLKCLLQQAVENPDQSIMAYSLVTPRSASVLPDPCEVLSEPQYTPVMQLFVSVAQRMPEQQAICHGDRTWTYGELQSCSATLAQVLLASGLTRGDVVAVAGPKSFGLFASVIGIMRSGGVLLTIDPDLPTVRKQLMLQEAGAQYLICLEVPSDQGVEVFDEMAWRGVVHVNPDTGEVVASSYPLPDATIPLPHVASDDPAYIFFTSGTTGTPKGILGKHKGLSHFSHWQRHRFDAGPQDRCMHFAALSFDNMLRDMFLPLTSGATLCIPEAGRAQAPQIWEWLEQQRISILHAVATVVQSWLGDIPAHITLGALRWAFFSGEPLTDAVVKRWRQAFPQAGGLVNLYGTTETVICTCCHIIPSELPPGVQPVGKPIPHTQALILNPNGQLCGVGELGEIVFRTPFRTRGYINAPEEMKKRFVKNPFRCDDEDILYYTGDQGRYRPDGSISILGRLDHQIKVRGVRIEPDEITAVLAQHPSVQSCIVVARKNAHDQEQLVAYVVANPQNRVTIAVLRAYLLAHLPVVMLPAAFVFLEAFPRTATGKIDRHALPAPEPAEPMAAEACTAPRTPIEDVLARIWERAIGAGEVGIHDNFFDLGGHSLLAMQIMAQLHGVFRVELPLRALFEAPTVAELAQQIEVAQQITERHEVPALRPVPRHGMLPVSFAQQRLWFLTHLEAGSPVYHVCKAWKCTGALNVPALEQSFETLVRRHEILRTAFPEENGNPVQRISREAGICIPLHDLGHLDVGGREAAMRQHVTGEVSHPFDLEQGPLLRIRLFRLAPEEHVLVLAAHHMIFDAWSADVLWRELATLYAASCAGQAVSLPPLPLQYADFAVWQRQWLDGDVLEAQVAYWKQRLSGAPSILELPADRPRPMVQTTRGAKLPLELPLPLTEALKALGRREGATLFMTLLAAFKVLLFRYTRQNDLTIGTPIANRNRTEIEPLIGFFVNTLALRTKLSGNVSFCDLLSQIREVALGAYAHQDLPFEKLVEELQVNRDVRHHPVFQVMFALQTVPIAPLELPGLTLSPVDVDNGTALFDLSLVLWEDTQGLRGFLEYSADLFDAATIDRMARHFHTLLEHIAAYPESHLASLPLLTPAERHQLLVDWNDTDSPHPKELCIHHLFEAQAQQSPHSAAAVFEGESLSYRELNRRANQLAHYLQACGVGPETVVGIYLERCFDMAVGLLGILKAGGAYMPLEPSYPQARLRWMLEEVQPQILLTQQRWVDDLPKHQTTVLCMDTDWHVIECHPQTNPASGVRPNHLAYVTYTSGSTGQPNGVLIEHQSLVNHSVAVMQAYDLQTRDRVLQFASLTFDVAAEELFPSWCRGATVVFQPEQGFETMAAFHQFLEQERLTVLNLPASFWHTWLAEWSLGEMSWLTSLRLVIAGSETVLPQAIERWQELAGDRIRLLNAYGLTEATITSTLYEPGARQDHGHRFTVPMGKPIANTQVYVLDDHLHPVPIGVPGELYIGGGGLARGYLHRPERTAEAFIPHPFRQEPGARLYKTGDLVRYLSDGNLEYLGRADQQINLRGYRIEPGDAEAALVKHPAIRQAAVCAQDDRAIPGLTRLIAYVVPGRAPAPRLEDLHHFLKQTLPDYMLPAAVVPLDALPMTTSGKIDRQALPAPVAGHENSGDAFAMPRTPIEDVLAGIWMDVLGTEHMNTHDNFFALGGHSLLAMQVIARTREVLQAEVPLRALFEAPTVASFARYILERKDTAQPAPVPPIEPVPREGPVPVSIAQEPLWHLVQALHGIPHLNMSTAMCISGELDAGVLEQSFNELIRRHETLRTSFAAVDARPVQIIAETLQLTMKVEDLRALAATEREVETQRQVEEAFQTPFDLSKAPLVRARLLRLAEWEYILIVTVHHMISDGWSMDILCDELSVLYNAISTGNPSPLPELPVQYADYTHWQFQWQQSEAWEHELTYWKEQLRGCPPILTLSDREHDGELSLQVAYQTLDISKQLTDALKHLGHEAGSTLFMSLLAAFKMLLFSCTGQEDICVNTLVANRNRPGTEKLIGLFTNMVFLRTDLSGDPTLREVLQSVRNTTLAAYMHHEVPIQQLVSELRQEQLSQPPLLPKALFVLQQTLGNYLAFSDLSVSEFDRDGYAKVPPAIATMLDLTIIFRENSQGLTGSCIYKSTLFEDATISMLLGYFKIIIEHFVKYPDRRLSVFDL